MENQFHLLDAQSEPSRMAQLSPEESREFNEWIDMCEANFAASNPAS